MGPGPPPCLPLRPPPRLLLLLRRSQTLQSTNARPHTGSGNPAPRAAGHHRSPGDVPGCSETPHGSQRYPPVLPAAGTHLPEAGTRSPLQPRSLASQQCKSLCWVCAALLPTLSFLRPTVRCRTHCPHTPWIQLIRSGPLCMLWHLRSSSTRLGFPAAADPLAAAHLCPPLLPPHAAHAPLPPAPVPPLYCRCSEELYLYIGASIGYWRGDIKGLMDDIGEWQGGREKGGREGTAACPSVVGGWAVAGQQGGDRLRALVPDAALTCLRRRHVPAVPCRRAAAHPVLRRASRL